MTSNDTEPRYATKGILISCKAIALVLSRCIDPPEGLDNIRPVASRTSIHVGRISGRPALTRQAFGKPSSVERHELVIPQFESRRGPIEVGHSATPLPRGTHRWQLTMPSRQSSGPAFWKRCCDLHGALTRSGKWDLENHCSDLLASHVTMGRAPVTLETTWLKRRRGIKRAADTAGEIYSS